MGRCFSKLHRLSVFHRRALDVDVVLDLMIHDLDIVLKLCTLPGNSAASRRPEDSLPQGRHRQRSPGVCFRLRGQLHRQPGWSTETVRKLRFFQPHQYLSLDYARQDLLIINLAPRSHRRWRGQKVKDPSGSTRSQQAAESRSGNPCCWRSGHSWNRFAPAGPRG